MKAVIPAAGRGTRLRSLTGGRPKALVDLAGRPLLDWVLEAVAAPVDAVCLVVAPESADAFRRRYGDRWEGRPVRYVLQPEATGVADAVARARPEVQGGFAVVMGDAFYEKSLGPALETWRASGAAGAVLVEPVSRPPEDPVGLAWLRDGEVERLRKARWRGQTPHRVAGTFCLPEAAFQGLEELEPGPTGEVELEQLVNRLLDRGHRFVGVEYDGWRRNINTPGDLRRAEEHIRAAGG